LWFQQFQWGWFNLLDVLVFLMWLGLNSGVFVWQWIIMPMETIERFVRVMGSYPFCSVLFCSVLSFVILRSL